MRLFWLSAVLYTFYAQQLGRNYLKRATFAAHSAFFMDNPAVTAHRHFVLHKPYGYLSQFTSGFAKEVNKKHFLGELGNFPPGTMAIGRLDADSEGLLLLTTDGRVSEQVRGRHVEKEYYAQVDGQLTPAALAHLGQGVNISLHGTPYRTLPSQARLLAAAPDLPPRARRIRDDRHGPTSWVAIIVTEGKYRQVRKMTAAVGFPTLRLVRVRVGEVWLDGLLAGTSREVTSFFKN